METINLLSRILAYPLFLMALLYQKTISPDHGVIRHLFSYGYCKFYPTCSAYAVAILKKEGILGIPKIFIRVVSCNPASLGGVDLPYQNYPNIK